MQRSIILVILFVGGRQFQLSWSSLEPQCGGVIRGEESGHFQSPGYPRIYPNDRDCIWTVYVDRGKRISFHFATINIEHHPNCSYDFLKVYFQ